MENVVEGRDVRDGKKNMDNSMVIDNLPPQLSDLVERWNVEGKSFYLGPENIFFYGHHRLQYQNGQSIPIQPGSWRAHSKDCRVPNRLTRGEIDEIQYELFKNCLPRRSILSVDFICNFHCRMCPYHGETENIYKEQYSRQRKRVTKDKVYSRLEKLRDLGVESVQLGSNGEYFLRADWEDIWSYAYSLGFKLSATTNATMLDEQTIKRLLKFSDRLDAIKVSLNALSYDVWKIVNGCNNRELYDTAMAAVNILAKLPVNVVASFVVTNQNTHELGDFIRYWTGRGVKIFTINEIPAHIFFEGSANEDNSYWPYYLCSEINDTFVVEVDGDIAPCCQTAYCYKDNPLADIPQINIDEPIEVIKDKWKDTLRERSFKSICATCPTYKVRTENMEILNSVYGTRGKFGYDGSLCAKGKKDFSLKKVRMEWERFKKRFRAK